MSRVKRAALLATAALSVALPNSAGAAVPPGLAGVGVAVGTMSFSPGFHVPPPTTGSPTGNDPQSFILNGTLTGVLVDASAHTCTGLSVSGSGYSTLYDNVAGGVGNVSMSLSGCAIGSALGNFLRFGSHWHFRLKGSCTIFGITFSIDIDFTLDFSPSPPTQNPITASDFRGGWVLVG